MKALTPRQGRILALAILAGLVLLVLAVVAAPIYWVNRHYDQDIDTQSDLLARYSRVAATGPELAKLLEVLKAKDTHSFFLKSTVPALAASEMQEIVKGVVEGNGGKITSMQIPEHKDDGNYRKVTVNIQMSATIGATQKILYALETQRPYFLLDNVSIRSTTWRGGARNANAPEPEYAVLFDVAGYAALGKK